jgi:HD-GYP domain-containing protein (c-di-GMP phosphodiesterase class II)
LAMSTPPASAQTAVKPLAVAPAASQHKDVILDQDGEQWQGASIVLPFAGRTLTLLIIAPLEELLADAIAIRDRGIIIASLLLALGIVLAMAFARLASRPLRALMEEARKIERFEFDQPLEIQTNILEVAQLVSAMGRMKSTIHHFLDVSIALSGETQFPRLLAFLLHEMQAITHAQGGILYLVQADNAARLQGVQAAWQEKELADMSTLADIDLAVNPSHPVAQALQSGAKTQVLSREMIRDYFVGLVPESAGLTMLVLPLSNRNNERLGALILFINEQTRALTPERLAFAEALSSTASVALYTQGLVNEQKQLLESFIQLIAGAIDAKSPYTGGHCQRVPELTKLLAQAACEQQEGPFKDFTLTEDEWEQLHIAAWLHDCGKVTTPEYVVDKATKLETLYDRIHEVRMRFEVLKRDAEISYWQALAQGGDAAQCLSELQATLTQLDDDYAFVATCNEGGEFMAPQKIERLQQLASRRWRRTLSDRIGISHEEKQRKAHHPEPSLPVWELLLADKPDHIFVRSASENLPADNPWGFKINVPEYLYNRGELYNLSVSRGTLSEEERYKINEHIIQTIMMLEKLPFPRHLRCVPEIAGGHHEKMDGTGYPKRLTGSQMSVEARMMAIADIFEALTAADRPYKKGKKLSEALKIMSFMCKDQHIDPQLFALFLQSGVYRVYAERYMQAEQMDDVDIQQYLTPQS